MPQLVQTIDAAENLEVLSGPTNFLRILQLNTSKEPFTDPVVRQALNYAIDKQVVADVPYNGFATVMTAPIPASAFGHVEQPPYSYDPEKAREMLGEAGYPDGFEVIASTAEGEEVARARLLRSTLNGVTWPHAIAYASQAQAEGTESPRFVERLMRYGEENTEYEYDPEFVPPPGSR